MTRRTMSLFTALALASGAVDLKVDHITVAGRQLSAMQKMFDAAGIHSEFGGKHTNGMTEMAIASFPDGSYLELIAAQPGASVARHYWAPFIEKNGGACAWAVAVKDVAAEARRLQSSGFESKPVASGRKRPDGVELKWQSATLGPDPQGSFFPFMIQDLTPREQRVYPHGKPSAPGINGVAKVVIAVRDLDRAIPQWRSAFGLGEPKRQTDTAWEANLAWFEGTPVVLAAAAGRTSIVASRISEFGEAPFAFVLGARSMPPAASRQVVTWFGHRIGWFEPATLNGARIAIELQP